MRGKLPLERVSGQVAPLEREGGSASRLPHCLAASGNTRAGEPPPLCQRLPLGAMSVEMAIWRMTSGGPERLTFVPLEAEQRLEDMIVADPALAGLDLVVIGRQVMTPYG